MYRCPHCRVNRTDNHFQSYKGHPNGWCRLCRSECESKRRRRLGIKKAKRSKIKGDTKLCLNCKKFKLFNKFSPSSKGLARLSSYCKICIGIKYKDTNRNNEAVARYRKKHRARYKTAHRIHQFNRINKIRASTNKPIVDKIAIDLYSKKTCYYCNLYVSKKKRTIDHKTPLKKGGSHSVNNIVMACRKCNCSKGSKTEKEFRRYLHDRR